MTHLDSTPTKTIDYCAVPGVQPVLTPELIMLAEEAISTYERLRSTQITALAPDVMCLHDNKSLKFKKF